MKELKEGKKKEVKIERKKKRIKFKERLAELSIGLSSSFGVFVMYVLVLGESGVFVALFMALFYAFILGDYFGRKRK